MTGFTDVTVKTDKKAAEKEAAKDSKKEAKTKTEERKFTAVHYPMWHPTQGKRVPTGEYVTLEFDEWVDMQLNARNLKEQTC